MNIRPIITDEQLRDYRDGLLAGPQRRLVAIQIEVDEAVAARFDGMKTELHGLETLSPPIGFSSKIMAQLTAEQLVKTSAHQKKSDWIIKSFFIILTVFMVGSLLILFKSLSTTTVQLPAIKLHIDWAKIIGSRAFLWSIWLGCLLPAIMLVYHQLNKPKDFVFG